MKIRFAVLPLFVAIAAVLPWRIAIAGAPTYAQVADFNAKVSRFAVDPTRARIYATAPDQNAVLVYDTTKLALLKTIPIGSSPRGCCISPDGSKLYVANSGSTTAGIGVI